MSQSSIDKDPTPGAGVTGVAAAAAAAGQAATAYVQPFVNRVPGMAPG